MLKKPQSTILGEALVAALDNRDRAVANLRNAVSTSEEDASLNRDQMILDALTGYNTAEQALHSRSMDTLSLAPPTWGTIGTRGEVLGGPGAPGTEEPLPETPVPGDPTPTEDDPSVPRKDKIPPAQPVQPSGGAMEPGPGIAPGSVDAEHPLGQPARRSGIPDQNVVEDAGERVAATTDEVIATGKVGDGVSPRTPSGQVDVNTPRAVRDMPQA